MRSTYMEPLVSAPLLLSAYRKGPEEFGVAAGNYAAAPRISLVDAGSEECLELLDHLVYRLGAQEKIDNEGLRDACIFLLEHLAARFQCRNASDWGAVIQ